MKRMRMSVKNDITFRLGCEEYLQDCESRNLRLGTIRHYQDSMNQLCKYIDEDMLIKDMDKSTMDSLILTLRKRKDINDISLYTYARDLKTLMYFFMKREYISPFKIILAKADKQPIETYSDSELIRLLKKPNIKQCTFTEYKSWVIVNFLLSTGLRQNSLINIKIKDIDFANSVVYVNVTKNRKPLIIPLNDDILKIVQEYLKYREGNAEDYLFCNVYGKQLAKSTLYHSMYVYNKNRGIELTGLHRFRHTFAKKWVTMGGSVVTLQKILGHSSLAITENYLNMLTCDIKRDIDKFNILREFKKESIKLK
ncbi:MAG: tyrosine-type recombinase/integrase [Hungatella sp.]|jgi:integrase/recombinase XerD|nr:tyrosine-type recombinase/integrase [Hungatella sp.]